MSASVNQRKSGAIGWALSTPWRIAHNLPVQPGGRASPDGGFGKRGGIALAQQPETAPRRQQSEPDRQRQEAEHQRRDHRI
jgi:hypothetical protein